MIKSSSLRPQVYSFDPYANVTDSQQHLIVGGQHTLTLSTRTRSDKANLQARHFSGRNKRILGLSTRMSGRGQPLLQRSGGRVRRPRTGPFGTLPRPFHDCTTGGEWVSSALSLSRDHSRMLSRTRVTTGTEPSNAASARSRSSPSIARFDHLRAI